MPDFLSSIGVDPSKVDPDAAAPARTYDPTDAAIRTVYGETLPGASKEERQAIASVIVNRAAKSGKNFADVVQEAGQFEPWSNAKARARMDALQPGSEDYKAIAADVGDVLAGKSNPYPTYTHFYAPKAQKELGRPTPDFDKGDGQDIGNTRFFAGDYGGAGASGADTFLTSIGVDPATMDGAPKEPKAPGAQLTEHPTIGVGPDGSIVFRDTGKPASPGQQTAIAMYNKAGAFDADAPEGSKGKPFVQRNPEDTFPPGTWYFAAAPRSDMEKLVGKGIGLQEGDVKDGQLVYVPDTASEAEGRASRVGKGGARGLEDIPQTILTGLSAMDKFVNPNGGGSEILNNLRVGQMQFNAKYNDDPWATGGRIGGQIVGSAIPIAGTEAAAAPLLARLGGVGRFIAGEAGTKALPASATALERMAQLGTRGASLATSGAVEGGTGAALTSSANDEPVGKQVLTGMLFGSAVKPVGVGVLKGAERFIGGPSAKGAVALTEQQQRATQAASLPTPVDLSQGQLSGAPAQQMAENAYLRGASGDRAANVVQTFKGEQQAALRSNVDKIAESIAGAPVETGGGGKAVSDTLNAARDKAQAAVNAAYDEARARGNDAMLATAKDVREGVLDSLRADYDLDRVKSVTNELEKFGEKGAPTARELYEMRSRLTNLANSDDTIEAGAARKARIGVDAYIQKALDNDLFLGDPDAVRAWKTAVGKRAEMGKLFEGDDLIDALTERTNRGGGMTLKVDPAEATNYIFNRSDLGFVGKRNLGRDLTRLRTVLGPDSDEWNGLRAEAFKRIARAGEGPPENGEAQFSGQKFKKAWDMANRNDPNVMGTLFTPDERKLISDFAEVAQIATTPVKGGDNPSNTAITAKKIGATLLKFLAPAGGAAGGYAGGHAEGAAMGAIAGTALNSVLKEMRDFVAVNGARKMTYGAKPVTPQVNIPGMNLVRPVIPAAAGIAGNRLVTPTAP